MLQHTPIVEPPEGPECEYVPLPLPSSEAVTAKEKIRGWREALDDDDHAVLALRNLIFDICNHNGGGHGGSAIGMSAIGVALFKHVMRYNPKDPSWFDRDRFVLSNGEKFRERSRVECRFC